MRTTSSQHPVRQLYDFPVALRPIFDEDGVELPKHKHIVRTDTTPKQSFGVVSNIYRLIPHTQVEAVMQPLIRQIGGAAPEVRPIVEKAGGRFILEYTFRDHVINLPGHNIPGQRRVGDAVALRAYASNSYLRDQNLTFQIGALVLRCLNGATAFDGVFNLSVKHVGEDRPIDLPDARVVLQAFEKTGEVWRNWAEMALVGSVRTYLITQAKRMGLLTDRVHEKESVRFGTAETVWDLYNAFTYVITHSSKRLQESSKVTRSDKLNYLFDAALRPREE